MEECLCQTRDGSLEKAEHLAPIVYNKPDNVNGATIIGQLRQGREAEEVCGDECISFVRREAKSCSSDERTENNLTFVYKKR